MEITGILVVYGVLVGITVLMHEGFHLLSAKLVGAKKIRVLLCRRGIGFNIDGINDKISAYFVLLSPQLLTGMYLVIAILSGGLIRLIAVILTTLNLLSSYYDFKEAVTISRTGV